jgi:dihydroorotate dehydrogenase (NAD+) catalytic subunit
MIELFGTTFQNPILLAAGTAGFGREVDGVIDLDRLGGLITKSVSPEPRNGNPPPRVAEFPVGMLNSVGLANPGVESVVATALPWLAQRLRRARVIVNVVGSTPDDYAAVVARLTGMPVVTAFELNLSCPNTSRGGEEFGANDDVLADVIRRCLAVADKPIVVKLSPTLPDIGATAAVVAEAGADGVSVINTIPGILFEQAHGRVDRSHPRVGAGSGGVSGPALLPVGVLAVQRVRARTELPVIGCGGIRTIADVRQYLSVGASLVAVGTSAMAAPRRPEQLVSAWSARG